MLIACKSTTGADWQAIRYSINNETFNKVVTLLKVRNLSLPMRETLDWTVLLHRATLAIRAYSAG
jgi:hypothetical protein